MRSTDIGAKLRAARLSSKLTQEQVAQSLGVSRQTVSNCENGKTYPDIISVVKLSDLYNISLDNLLKEEKPMSDYLNYLKESIDTVRSKRNLTQIIIIAVYLLIWAFSMIVFWFFTGGSDAMGYSLMFLWILLPVTTFILSVVIGKNNLFGKWKWLLTLFFGIMYMLAEYGTFKAANSIAFDRLNAPELGMVLSGAIISAIGILAGLLFNRKRLGHDKDE